MEAAPHPWPALGVLLMRDGLVEKTELEDILSEQLDRRQQRLSGRRLGEILVQRGRVTPDQVARLVAEQFELPFVDFDVSDIDFEVAGVLSEDDARRFSAVAISRSPNGVYLLAIAEPSMVLFSDELRRLLGTAPRFAVVGPGALETAIEAIYGGTTDQQPEPANHAEPQIEDDPGREAMLLRFPASSGSAFELLESRITEASETPTPPLLGTLLVREGFVTESELDAALAQQRLSPSLRLGEILVDKGIVTPAVVARLVAEQYELPFVELDTRDVDGAVATRLPEELAHRLSAVPVAELADGSLEVAVADPSSAVRSDELRQALEAPLSFVVGSPDAIEALLDRVHTPLPEPAPEPPSADHETVILEPDVAEEDSEPDAEHEMPSVAFVLDAFSTPWHDEPPFSESEVEVVEVVEMVEAEAVEHVEPELEETVAEEAAEPELEPPLVFHVVAAAPVEEQPLDDESDWASRLSLVEEVANLEQRDEPETELTTELEVEADVVEEVEADVVELVWHSRPVLEAVPDEVVEADVLELAWTAPVETEEKLESEEPPRTDSDPTATAEVAGPDIFGIGMQHVTETIEPEDEPDVAIETGEAVAAEELVETFDAFDALEPPVASVTAFDPPVWDVDDESPAVVDELVDAAEDVDDIPDAVELTASVGELETFVAEALAAGAATIHFSPLEDGLAVRARIDGFARDFGTASHAERDELVARLETDGAVRTHVVMTSRGPKTTLFVRERTGAPTTLAEIGLDEGAATTARGALARPSGAVLVCGPTGSGVTTTLHAMLEELATGDRVVTTIENPVERTFDGADQIEVDPTNGVTFASALRELTLADTDVTLVGELEDRATAGLALKSAFDGALVVAGFRAPGSVEALGRLSDLGVERAVLAGSVTCIVSQRLLRTVCADCHETYYATPDDLAALDQAAGGSPRLLVRGSGCPSCGGTGFRGRIGIFEVLPVTEEIRELVAEGASAKKLRKAARAAGMRTLRDEGVRLCLDGVTTVAEVERVLGPTA